MSDHCSSWRAGGKGPPDLPRPDSPRPDGPRADFPLRTHQGTGYWCEKIRGRAYYFGKVADDPQGVAAEAKCPGDKDDLEAGRDPGGSEPTVSP